MIKGILMNKYRKKISIFIKTVVHTIIKNNNLSAADFFVRKKHKPETAVYFKFQNSRGFKTVNKTSVL